MISLISSIPLAYRDITALVLAGAIFGYSFIKGENRIQQKWDKAVSESFAVESKAQMKHAEASVKIVTEYIDRIKTIREKGATITREVPVYVTEKENSACVIPTGFVRLHDSAASNRPDESAGNPHEGTTEVDLSLVAAVVTENYGRCNENAEQLKSLQNFVRSLESDE